MSGFDPNDRVPDKTPPLDQQPRSWGLSMDWSQVQDVARSAMERVSIFRGTYRTPPDVATARMPETGEPDPASKFVIPTEFVVKSLIEHAKEAEKRSQGKGGGPVEYDERVSLAAAATSMRIQALCIHLGIEEWSNG